MCTWRVALLVVHMHSERSLAGRTAHLEQHGVDGILVLDAQRLGRVEVVEAHPIIQKTQG
jgi:hypothetical protein